MKRKAETMSKIALDFMNFENLQEEIVFETGIT